MIYILYFKNKNSDKFRVDVYSDKTFVLTIYCSEISFVDEIRSMCLYDNDHNLITTIHYDRIIETNYTWTEKKS